jgi:hypothetical protein
VGPTSAYCILVGILPGATTTVTLEARDENGVPTRPIAIQVTQAGTPPVAVPAPVANTQIDNMVAGVRPVPHDLSVSTGDWMNMTDESLGTEIRASNTHWFQNETPPQ